MKETNFINQNKDSWKKFEQILKDGSKNPDDLNDLFIKVTDDLSYSQTFYKHRTVRVYLNSLAQQIFSKIYNKKRNTWKQIKLYVTEDLPKIMYSARKDLLISTIILIISVSIGIFSSIKNKTFSKEILGDKYVEVTKNNIKNKKPMHIYYNENKLESLESFYQIGTNNLRVDILTFISGLFFGIGSIIVMIHNGIMLGTFHYLFVNSNYFWVSLATIYLHGTLEIFCLILCCMAGIRLGKGYLFPGTLSRFLSFRIAAVEGIKIILFVMPITIFAAFIESFITGLTGISIYIKLTLILLCLVFIIYYFIIYPYLKFRNKPIVYEQDFKYQTEKDIDYNQIKNTGQIISEGIIFLKNNMSSFLKFLLISLIIFTTLMLWINNSFFDFSTNHKILINRFIFYKFNNWFNWDMIKSSLMMLIFCISAYSFFIITFLKKSKQIINNISKLYLSSIICGIIIFIPLFFISGTFWFLVWILLYTTFIIFLNIYMLDENKEQTQFFELYFSSFSNIILINFSLLIMGLLMYLLISTTVFDFYFISIIEFFKIDSHNIEFIKFTIIANIILCILASIFYSFILVNSNLYFAQKEKKYGLTLFKNLKKYELV